MIKVYNFSQRLSYDIIFVQMLIWNLADNSLDNEQSFLV